MTLDRMGPVRDQPSRARSAKGKQVSARGLGARSRPPMRAGLWESALRLGEGENEGEE
jgi:hypothetical protein